METSSTAVGVATVLANPVWQFALNTTVTLAVAAWGSVQTIRFTIGARQEREHNAFRALTETVFRRVVKGESVPDYATLATLLEAKATECMTRPRRIGTPSQLLGAVYLRVVEFDFLEPNERESLAGAVRASMDVAWDDAAIPSWVLGTGRTWLMKSLLIIVFAVGAGCAGFLTFTAMAYLTRQPPSAAWTAAVAVLSMLIGLGLSVLQLAEMDSSGEQLSDQAEEAAWGQVVNVFRNRGLDVTPGTTARSGWVASKRGRTFVTIARGTRAGTAALRERAQYVLSEGDGSVLVVVADGNVESVQRGLTHLNGDRLEVIDLEGVARWTDSFRAAS